MDVTKANDALLDSWKLALLGGTRRMSARTVKHYLDELHRFAGWLEAHARPSEEPGDLAAVTRRDVEAWVVDLRAAGIADNTVRNRWVALRNFYGWASREGEVEPNPVADLVVAKPNPPAPDVLTDGDIKALLKACDGREFVDRRDMAMFRLMLATGMRVSECCDLTLADLDLANRVVMIRHGKGDRARLVRFDPQTAAALDRYKRARARHRLAGLPNLWVGHRGPMTRKGVPNRLDLRAGAAGIGHVHPHQLRHTFAHRFLTNGGNEGDLQKLGGWENADVMRRYGSALATDRALAAYDNVSPMEGL
jgi:site-specific recombinase XerD